MPERDRQYEVTLVTAMMERDDENGESTERLRQGWGCKHVNMGHASIFLPSLHL